MKIWMNKNIYLKEIFIFDNKKLLFFLLTFFITLFLIYNFNYDSTMNGGGFFYKASDKIFNSNIFFYIISFFSISLFLKIIFYKNINDILLILLLIGFDPDPFIYHKTYDPLLLCLFLLLFENSLFNKLSKINEKKFAFNLIGFYILVFLMYIFVRTTFV